MITKVLFAVLKHSSFWPSADVITTLIESTGRACLLCQSFLCHLQIAGATERCSTLVTNIGLPKSFWNILYKINKTPGACSIKHERFVIYGFRSKLMCLSKLVFLFKLVYLSKLVCLSSQWKCLTIEKTLAYYKICKISLNYESVMFYSTRP